MKRLAITFLKLCMSNYLHKNMKQLLEHFLADCTTMAAKGLLSVAPGLKAVTSRGLGLGNINLVT
jgi:hypothetical protein